VLLGLLLPVSDFAPKPPNNPPPPPDEDDGAFVGKPPPNENGAGEAKLPNKVAVGGGVSPPAGLLLSLPNRLVDAADPDDPNPPLRPTPLPLKAVGASFLDSAPNTGAVEALNPPNGFVVDPDAGKVENNDVCGGGVPRPPKPTLPLLPLLLASTVSFGFSVVGPKPNAGVFTEGWSKPLFPTRPDDETEDFVVEGGLDEVALGIPKPNAGCWSDFLGSEVAPPRREKTPVEADAEAIALVVGAVVELAEDPPS
jgi:hypothetical protein